MREGRTGKTAKKEGKFGVSHERSSLHQNFICASSYDLCIGIE
jgi:hypothetical protein